jgi:hypothetical protein
MYRITVIDGLDAVISLPMQSAEERMLYEDEACVDAKLLPQLRRNVRHIVRIALHSSTTDIQCLLNHHLTTGSFQTRYNSFDTIAGRSFTFWLAFSATATILYA